MGLRAIKVPYRVKETTTKRGRPKKQTTGHSSRMKTGDDLKSKPLLQIRETKADKHSRKQSSAILYASDMNMVLNHASVKTIRSTLEKKLRYIGSSQSPIQLRCSSCQMRKLKRHPQKLLNHSYQNGEVHCSDVCGPIRTEGQHWEKYMTTFTDIG